jgi:hypothetical protein
MFGGFGIQGLGAMRRPVPYKVADASVATYVAALSAPPSNALRQRLDTFAVTIKAGPISGSNIFAKCDGFLLIGLEHAAEADGFINFIAPGTYNGTKHGAGTYTPGQGWAGDGTTGYWSTGFVPTTAPSAKFTKDSAHQGIWSRTELAGTQVDFGSRNTVSSVSSYFIPRLATDRLRLLMNQGTTVDLVTTSSLGHLVGRRSASNALKGYRNAASVGTSTQASVNMSDKEFYVGALNTNDAASNFSTRQIACVHWGESLSDNEVIDLYNALQVLFIGGNSAFAFGEITLSATVKQNLPDGLGGDVGEGFTCTGMVRARDGSGFWISNDGRDVFGDSSYQPSLVKVSIDGVTKLQEIDLLPAIPTLTSAQGVDIAGDGTFYIAAVQEDKFHHLSATGALLSSHTFSGANGLAIDTTRGKLLIGAGTTISRCDMDGANPTALVTGLTDLDHIHYNADLDWFFASYGANGSVGKINAYDALGVLKRTITLSDALAVEGIWLDLANKHFYATHDGYFHTSGNNKNQLQKYVLPNWVLPI